MGDRAVPISSELLLDEKRSQMRQLPSAGETQDAQLDQRPPDDLRICGLALISKFGLPFLFVHKLASFLTSTSWIV